MTEIGALLNPFIAWFADLERGRQALLIIAFAVIAIPILLALSVMIWRALPAFLAVSDKQADNEDAFKGQRYSSAIWLADWSGSFYVTYEVHQKAKIEGRPARATQRLVTADRLQSDLGLEGRGVVATGSFHGDSSFVGKDRAVHPLKPVSEKPRPALTTSGISPPLDFKSRADLRCRSRHAQKVTLRLVTAVLSAPAVVVRSLRLRR